LFGFGVWKLPKDIACNTVFHAIVSGIRHFDCASDYGNEVEVGQGINKAISEGIVKREDLFITSKLWNTNHLAEHVEPACRKSLADLNCGYLDLYLIHFPIALRHVPEDKKYPPEWVYDPDSPSPKIVLEKRAPMHLTWAAMEKLVDKQLTRRIGVSNFNVQLLSDVLSYAVIPPYANQIELHPYLVQQKLVTFCQDNNVQCVAFSPLGSASYIEIGGDAGFGKGPLSEAVVLKIAEGHGRTAAQVILRWNVQRGVAVIPKSSQASRNTENSQIFDFELTEEEMSQIASLNRNVRFNDPGVYGVFMGQAMPIFC